MNSDDARAHRNTWRLLLCIATGDEDARRTLAREVGEDVLAWYHIACLAALHAVAASDSEYLLAEATRALDPSAEELASALRPMLDTIAAAGEGSTNYPARAHTIGVIESRLADLLDQDTR